MSSKALAAGVHRRGTVTWLNPMMVARREKPRPGKSKKTDHATRLARHLMVSTAFG